MDEVFRDIKEEHGRMNFKGKPGGYFSTLGDAQEAMPLSEVGPAVVGDFAMTIQEGAGGVFCTLSCQQES